mgnify:CR=1 FL=1
MIAALLGILPAFALSRASEYLGNNQRDGFVDASIPAEPVLLWTYQERHAPKSAWPEPYGELQFIDFDYADQTTLGDGLVFFGSSADHTIRALDQETGEERWSFYTEGPVRFATVLHKKRLYAVSDDGNLYCLDATEGTLDWKLRLAPGEERCIGEGQMVSKWPCRSGVLIEGDRLAEIGPAVGALEAAQAEVGVAAIVGDVEPGHAGAGQEDEQQGQPEVEGPGQAQQPGSHDASSRNASLNR